MLNEDLMNDEEEDAPQCASCQLDFPLEELTDYFDSFPVSAMKGLQGKLLLCELCAHTFAGNSLVYSSQYDQGHAGKILQAICIVGNKILQRIDEIEGCD